MGYLYLLVIGKDEKLTRSVERTETNPAGCRLTTFLSCVYTRGHISGAVRVTQSPTMYYGASLARGGRTCNMLQRVASV